MTTTIRRSAPLDAVDPLILVAAPLVGRRSGPTSRRGRRPRRRRRPSRQKADAGEAADKAKARQVAEALRDLQAAVHGDDAKGKGKARTAALPDRPKKTITPPTLDPAGLDCAGREGAGRGQDARPARDDRRRVRPPRLSRRDRQAPDDPSRCITFVIDHGQGQAGQADRLPAQDARTTPTTGRATGAT